MDDTKTYLPREDCEICGGTGHISKSFFNAVEEDLPGICLPAGARCYCTVTDDEIVAELPGLFDHILGQLPKD
jgi:hypothetical protein